MSSAHGNEMLISVTQPCLGRWWSEANCYIPVSIKSYPKPGSSPCTQRRSQWRNVPSLLMELLKKLCCSAWDWELFVKPSLNWHVACYCENKSGSYRNWLLVPGGAVELVSFNNCTPSWWGIISVHYAVFHQHQLSCQELLKGCCCIFTKAKTAMERWK